MGRLLVTNIFGRQSSGKVGETQMKICYLASANSIHTQRWVKYFASHGHEVHLISPMPFRGNNIENVKLYVLRGFSPRIPIISLLVNLLFNVIQVKRWVREIKPDILHAHYITSYGFWGALSGFHPLVLSAWGSDILVAPKSSKINKAIVKFALRKADLITCGGENSIEEMVRLGANPKKLKLIYFGVDTQKFNPEQRNGKLREELGVSNSPAIISIRSLRPLYDVESLIKATPLVLEQVPETKFIIAGDGEQGEYLKTFAVSLGVSDSVRFVGRLPHNELPKYLASADIYVSTSLSDSGISVSASEAMACGLPVVVTDSGNNKKWIKGEENGFVIPVRDPSQLAEKIVYLLRNPDTRKRFGEMNRKIIKEKQNYEKEMRKMEKLYEGLQRDWGLRKK